MATSFRLGATAPVKASSAEPAATNGHVSTPRRVRLDLPVADLVFDPTLQCRVTVDQEVVAEYASAMRDDGASFPPIEVVRVGERLLVVDGWHRGAAAAAAELDTIPAYVTDGDHRDARRAAIGANAHHGLRRSNDDKRRALATALQDEEWAKLSNRELGEWVHVSHALVGKIRRHYGIQRGDVLTEAQIEVADGVLPPRWAALDWWGGDMLLTKIRQATSVAELADLGVKHGYTGCADQALALRAEELAGDAPWPWSADPDAASRSERAQGLDDLCDIEAAIMSADCPDRPALLQVAITAQKVERTTHPAYVATYEKSLHGRPALLERARSKHQELVDKRRAAGPSNHTLRDRILAIEHASEQALAVRAATPAVQSLLTGSFGADKLSPEAWSELRYQVAPDAADCADPTCPGWQAPRNYSTIPTCVVCSYGTEMAQTRMAADLERAADLILAGCALTIGEVVITREVIRALAERSDA